MGDLSVFDYDPFKKILIGWGFFTFLMALFEIKIVCFSKDRDRTFQNQEVLFKIKRFSRAFFNFLSHF